jgi:hypothetical protein
MLLISTQSINWPKELLTLWFYTARHEPVAELVAPAQAVWAWACHSRPGSEQIYVYDEAGTEYVDFGAGIAVTNRAPQTKILQGWPKLWANFRAAVGIFSQSVVPSLAI